MFVGPVAGAAALLGLACSGAPAEVTVLTAEEAAERRGADEQQDQSTEQPLPPQRVGGDLVAVAAITEGRWRAGESFIEERLPEGYADPTPPGAIEVKGYGSVRRAQITMTGVNRGNAGTLGNIGFFPLFNHIKRRDIAMTSPVESEYDGVTLIERAGELGEHLAANETPAESAMSMSFLYRSPDLGPTGVDDRDQRIEIIDTDPVTVVSMGFRGPYGLRTLDEERAALAAWIDGQTDWEIDTSAGFSMRVLSYNGPSVPRRIRWGELQAPVRPVPAPTDDASAEADETDVPAPGDSDG